MRALTRNEKSYCTNSIHHESNRKKKDEISSPAISFSEAITRQPQAMLPMITPGISHATRDESTQMISKLAFARTKMYLSLGHRRISAHMKG